MRFDKLLLTHNLLPREGTGEDKPQLPTVIKPGDETMKLVRPWIPPILQP